MNDAPTPAPAPASQSLMSRLLTMRRLVIVVTLLLSAALLLLDRPTALHWACAALAVRMLEVMVLALIVEAFGGQARRAVWGAVAGIVVVDAAWVAIVRSLDPDFWSTMIANPFALIAAIVGAVSALTSVAFGALAGIVCYFISLGLLYAVSVWNSMQPRDPKMMNCVMPVELFVFFSLTIGVPVTTVVTMLVVGILKSYHQRRTRGQPANVAAVGTGGAGHSSRLWSLGLHAVMLLLLGASVYFGWWIRPVFLSTRTRIAIDRLRQIEGHLGGHGPDEIFAPYQPGADHVTDARLREICYVAIHGESLRDDDVLLLGELSNVERVTVGGAHLSDVGIAHLKHLPSLTFLQISNTRLTGNGLKELQGLNNLETLKLTMCQIDDSGLANIGALKNLKTLSLEGTPISDAGLVGLKPLTHCTKIDLIGTNVGDGVVQFFKDMPNLRVLYVHQSTTSKATWDEVNRIMRERYKSP